MKFKLTSLQDIRDYQDEVLDSYDNVTSYTASYDEAVSTYGAAAVKKAGYSPVDASIPDYLLSAMGELEILERVHIGELTAITGDDAYSVMAGGRVMDTLQPGNNIMTVVLEPSNIMAKAHGETSDRIDIETQRLFYSDPYAKGAGGLSYLNDSYPDAGMVFTVLGANGTDDFFSLANTGFGIKKAYEVIKLNPSAFNLNIDLKLTGTGSASKGSASKGGSGFGTKASKDKELAYLGTSISSGVNKAAMNAADYAGIMGISTANQVNTITNVASRLAPQVGAYGALAIGTVSVSAYSAFKGDYGTAKQTMKYGAMKGIQTGFTQGIQKAAVAVVGPTTYAGLMGTILGAGIIADQLWGRVVGTDIAFGFGGTLIGVVNGNRMYSDSQGILGVGSIGTYVSSVAFQAGLISSYSTPYSIENDAFGGGGIATYSDFEGIGTGGMTSFDHNDGSFNISSSYTEGGFMGIGGTDYGLSSYAGDNYGGFSHTGYGAEGMERISETYAGMENVSWSYDSSTDSLTASSSWGNNPTSYKDDWAAGYVGPSQFPGDYIGTDYDTVDIFSEVESLQNSLNSYGVSFDHQTTSDLSTVDLDSGIARAIAYEAGGVAGVHAISQAVADSVADSVANSVANSVASSNDDGDGGNDGPTSTSGVYGGGTSPSNPAGPGPY